MRREVYDNDRAYLEGEISKVVGQAFTIYHAQAISMAEFLQSTTVKPKSILISGMGRNIEGRERTPGAPVKNYSVFIHCGVPGANRKPNDRFDADDLADQIIDALSDESRRTYTVAATSQSRTCTPSGSAPLFLTHGFDVFEVQLSIQ
jgi:hypothetical protein